MKTTGLEQGEMNWNASLYDSKHDFVAEYGKTLLSYVPYNKNNIILDLGCGTGVLTNQLAKIAQEVIGVDSSDDMILKAREQFKHIKFIVSDITELHYENKFNVIFSNAVFHWIKDHDLLLLNIYKMLTKDGILICEFGGEGNIQSIEAAFSEVSNLYNYEYKSKFNFPSTDNFKTLLDRNGFIIDEICNYERPTVLKDGRQGLHNWLEQFFALELAEIPKDNRTAILNEVEQRVQKELWNGKEWVADYKRLRVIAHK